VIPRESKLPSNLLRFRDLKCVGINNWPTLKRRIQSDGFPPGRRLGPNTRVWTEEEVERWWATRPSAAPPENVKPAAPVGSRDDGSRDNIQHPSDTNVRAAVQPLRNGGRHG
jgi:predicted DNA-binding transcriptional regulator AlpA